MRKRAKNKMIRQSKNDVRLGAIRIFAAMVITSLFAVSLAFASEIPDPVTAAERIEKLSATGILAFGFILSLATTAYLIKLQFQKFDKVIEASTKVIAETCHAMKQVTESINHCRHGRDRDNG